MISFLNLACIISAFFFIASLTIFSERAIGASNNGATAQTIADKCKNFWSANPNDGWTKSHSPTRNFEKDFSAQQIEKILTGLDQKDANLISGSDVVSSYACSYKVDPPYKGSNVEVRNTTVYSIPESKGKNLMTVLDEYSKHNAAPATQERTGEMIYYRYRGYERPAELHFGHNGEIFPLGDPTRMKKCFHVPIVYDGCNTQDYKIEKIDDNTAIMMIVAADVQEEPNEKKLFGSKRFNTYERNADLVIVRKVGNQFFIYDKMVKQSDQKGTIGKAYDYFNDTKNSVCVNDPSAFVNRMGIASQSIANDFSSSSAGTTRQKTGK